MPRVTFITATGCHLCHDALQAIETVRERLDFEFEQILIDGDSELERLYRTELPVVLIDGQKHFKFRVDPSELERRLQSRSR